MTKKLGNIVPLSHCEACGKMLMCDADIWGVEEDLCRACDDGVEAAENEMRVEGEE